MQFPRALQILFEIWPMLQMLERWDFSPVAGGIYGNPDQPVTSWVERPPAEGNTGI
jgi:hypothetical protein